MADLQVRYGSRHDEYRIVFDRTLMDIRSVKPDRIAILGDIFHNKIRLSPASIVMVAEFFLDLSEIAPTDVILGNHDLNLRQLEQGDAITPIFKIAAKLGKKDKAITVESPEDNVDYWKKALYFFPNSGVYDLGKNVVYGVFSCKDNQMVRVDNKDPEKTYIALWHGTLYGSKMDNGYDAIGEDNVKKETFKDFDVVMMGDIHEYQTFERTHEIEVEESQVKEYLRKGWELTEKTEEVNAESEA
jgi:DNA repair exonuclease SbcCD nuclease subunit